MRNTVQHSYIKRLRFYCNGALQVPRNVYFYDIGGLHTGRLNDSLWKRCLRREANVCSVNVGGSIATRSESEDNCQRIVKLVDQGPVVQSVVSLTSSLRAISLTILADSIYNFLKFFAEKM